MPEWITVVASLLAAMGGVSGIAALLQWRAQQDKLAAETETIKDSLDDAVLGRAQAMLEEQERMLIRRSEELNNAMDIIDKLRQEVARLRRHSEMLDAELARNTSALDTQELRLRKVEKQVNDV